MVRKADRNYGSSSCDYRIGDRDWYDFADHDRCWCVDLYHFAFLEIIAERTAERNPCRYFCFAGKCAGKRRKRWMDFRGYIY